LFSGGSFIFPADFLDFRLNISLSAGNLDFLRENFFPADFFKFLQIFWISSGIGWGATQGKTYLLPYTGKDNEWTPGSDFDGNELWARPSIQLIAIDGGVIGKAEELIMACEHCRCVTEPYD
jgi:hypothetical protein